MNPEQRIAQLEAQVAELTKTVKSLGSFNSIPLNIEKAFKSRLINNLQERVTDITDDFPADPLSVDVDEGGTSSYTVAAPPDYVLRVKIGGIYVAIGAYDI